MSDDGVNTDQVRNVLAGALAGLAKGLTASARMIEQASWILRPREPRAPEGEEPGAREPAAEGPAVAEPAVAEPAVAEPAAAETAVPGRAAEESEHARVAESHIADLADRPAAQVIAEIADLSTDELGRLYEHESTHKKRKTVLRAIERAAEPASSPPGAAAGPGPQSG